MMTPNDLDRLADAIADRVAALLDAPADDYLDLHGAASLLNCSTATVERRTRSGELPSVKVGRLRRYKRSALLELDRKKKGGCDHA